MQRLVVAIILMALAVAGCESSEPPSDYVARVGSSYLTQDEVQDALESAPASQDSADARRQIIEQWVTNELLYQEAKRQGLREEPDVKQLLQENERSVLISALVSTLYEQDTVRPSAAEVNAYYERHRQQLRLREPYLQVRHLASPNADSAAQARSLLQQAVIAGHADSTWSLLAHRFATDPSRALDLASNFYPAQRLFSQLPPLRDKLRTMSDGQIATLVRTDSLTHVLQLVERVPAGTVPPISWIEDEIQRRLTIQERKQRYARRVQRLRNEAVAREELEIPDRPASSNP